MNLRIVSICLVLFANDGLAQPPPEFTSSQAFVDIRIHLRKYFSENNQHQQHLQQQLAKTLGKQMATFRDLSFLLIMVYVLQLSNPYLSFLQAIQDIQKAESCFLQSFKYLTTPIMPRATPPSSTSNSLSHSLTSPSTSLTAKSTLHNSGYETLNASSSSIDSLASSSEIPKTTTPTSTRSLTSTRPSPPATTSSLHSSSETQIPVAILLPLNFIFFSTAVTLTEIKQLVNHKKMHPDLLALIRDSILRTTLEFNPSHPPSVHQDKPTTSTGISTIPHFNSKPGSNAPNAPQA